MAKSLLMKEHERTNEGGKEGEALTTPQQQQQQQQQQRGPSFSQNF